MQYRDPYIEICIEGPNSVLRGLSLADKEAVDRHHDVAHFRKGDVIINEGSRTGGLFCLASGKAKVFKKGAGGRDQIIRMLKPQNFLNYRSLFSENYNPFTITAIDESAVVIFERNYLAGLLRHNADLAIKFIKLITEELHFANNRLISLTQKHVRGRVAETLLLLRDTYGLEVDGRTLRILITREDFAYLSNMTTSNAIRTLSGFAAERIIEIKGKKILILDMVMLEFINESGQ